MIAELIQRERYLVIDHFLSETECLAVVKLLQDRSWQPAMTVNHETNKPQKTDFRTSDSLFTGAFPVEVQAMLLNAESRIEELLGIAPDRWEGWQANRYKVGQIFKPHNDTGLKVNKANERQYTVVLTIQAPVSGGRTEFTALDIKVPAVTGRLLIWDNLDAEGKPNADMIHQGGVVEAGEKWNMVNWIHAKHYR
jgi:prolyl 4-hydroxylase